MRNPFAFRRSNGRYYSQRELFWRRLDRRLFVGLNLIALFFLSVFVYAKIRDALAYQDFPEDGRMVRLEEYSLFTTVSGPAGTQPSVIILPGEGEDAGFWQAVQPALAQHAQTVVVEKPGFLWSESPESPAFDYRQLSTDLARVATDMEIGRFVLVTNSLGAFAALPLVADADRAGMAGAVLLDPPDMSPAGVDSLLRAYQGYGLSWRGPILRTLFWLGFGRFYGDLTRQSRPMYLYPPDVQPHVDTNVAGPAASLRYSHGTLLARLQERSEGALHSGLEAAANAPAITKVPILVLSRRPVGRFWRDLGAKEVRVDSVAAYIQLEAPERVVETAETLLSTLSAGKISEE